MSVVVETATAASQDLLDGLNHLLPQLSSTAPTLTMDDLETLIGAQSVSLLVARNEGTIIGSLTLVMFPIPTGTRAWIEDVVVDKDARSLGVGAALTNGAIDIAISHGARTVDLTSRPSREAANALYRKLGFEPRETNVYRFVIES
jgi:ribosomal protein S18 acetylase RimI-like enzyme